MTMNKPSGPQRDARIDALGNDDRSVLILKDILRDFNRDMQSVYAQIGPIAQAVRPIISGGGVGTAPEPLNFTCVVGTSTIFLSWDAPSPAARTYEIRRSAELDWNLAEFVTRTPSLTVNLAPLPTGQYFYLIKTLDAFGGYSTNFAWLIATVISPGEPTISASVIDNNVLLSWSTPVTSFLIDRSRIYRNDIVYGTLRGTFVSTFETVAGDYKYSIELIDIAGNIGPKGHVTVHVNPPPDYQLEDKRVSQLNGAKNNVIRISTGPTLLACVSTPELWDEHFIEDSWDQPSDQTGAGFPVYIQPTELTGWYEEVIDYGLVVTNTIITIGYQLIQIVPDVYALVKICYSSDNVSYTPYIAGSSQFIPSFRYLKFKIEFTASDNKALAELSLLQITLDVKREVDSGDVIALSTDTIPNVGYNGTKVFFNKTFKDIDSITCTADSIEPITIIYDFVDAPNPTEFKVFALDSTGNRVTYMVSWKARGIV